MNKAWIVINPDASRTCLCYKCGYKTVVPPENVLTTRARDKEVVEVAEK